MRHGSVYLDEILLGSSDDWDHLKNLHNVLAWLQKPAAGLAPAPRKVDAVVKAPKPQNKKELQSYRGVTNFYRRFPPNLSEHLQPLQLLLRYRQQCVWEREQDWTFQHSKELITKVPVLLYFDPAKPVVLTSLAPYCTVDGACVYTHGSTHDVARDILARKHAEHDAFFICDLRDIAKKVHLWRQQLPRIAPFYAIKACRDPVVVGLLNRLGVNFDCSNKGEISAVLNMEASPDRIVYANTVKSIPDLEFARKHGVRLMTFDCAEELAKITDRRDRLLLRMEADEEGVEHSFNTKFGCTFSEVETVLQEARNRECNVVGVAFHVGCAYKDPDIFARTIKRVKAVFDMAAAMGIHMTVLDIGGGFPGGLRNRDKFLKVCHSIRRATDLYFPESSGVQIIAEPGQFFVTSGYSLVVQVLGKRSRKVVVDGRYASGDAQ
ncbi:uncharacterized protein LOC142570738 [Dermacentor variabilis]|uniref:uncharacterized protein LOC142570738 n=1 Tax=Dermacentor variabilis TaxID=34621 RepID=UPI003F5BF5C0